MGLAAGLARAELPVIEEVEWQPFAAQATRVVGALARSGEPLSAQEQAAIDAAVAAHDVAKVQAILDARALVGIEINGEMRVRALPGEAAPLLVEQGWRSYLVKVVNQAGTTGALHALSPNALSSFEPDVDRTESGKAYRQFRKPPDQDGLWLDLAMDYSPPLTPTLSGLAVEYRLLHLYSRDRGKRDAKIAFCVGDGIGDLSQRNEVNLLFDCAPAETVHLNIKDEHGQPTTAALTIRDHQGRVYPLMAKRLEPDFFFQDQIYRQDGEVLKLPAGDYLVDMRRGPESLPVQVPLHVAPGTAPGVNYQVNRWIDPASWGWWSGDHHIHAAGCAHYLRPTQGVSPAAMLRHVAGEDLKVGGVLTWGPGFDFQKQFFCGDIDPRSTASNLLRYDVEVSLFGSHQSGHLVLLGLKEQIYPGGDSKKHWPTLGLNVLRWAKQQGAICGPAHSGNGIHVPDGKILSDQIPAFDGIGANEFIVDITHELPGPDQKLVPAIDIMSVADTNPVDELNMWYHVLNAGFRPRIAGETDFPCLTGDRVGMGRSYVKLDDKLDYAAWCHGLQRGRSYVSDGFSHLIDFHVDSRAVGDAGSELACAGPTTVRAAARVAAYLPVVPPVDPVKWTWQLEKARIGDSRKVPVEFVVNGRVVARHEIIADGTLQEIAFDTRVEMSSWLAIRILPSSHTNPVWVTIAGKPLRDRRSLEWCLKCVDQCWSQKERFIKPEELGDAVAAYEHAREVYRSRLAESASN